MDYDYDYDPNAKDHSAPWEILPIWLYLVCSLTAREQDVKSDQHVDCRHVRF
jgi:hypothetical protein